MKLRKMLANHHELARRLDELESRYETQFRTVFDAIRSLLEPVRIAPKRRIGFTVTD